jgi:DNA-binding NtrC family response regulator
VDDADRARTFEGMVARSQVMRGIFHLIDHLHATDATVLVTGESGTGKELVARAIHARSTRAGGPFVAVNCGALPENLLESELFGHARGAFTDARTAQAGVVELADHGTLFLDEVDALTAKGQVALLRFLEDQSYRPLGGQGERTVDVRIISASNRSLEGLADTKRFRADLMYRLRLLYVHLPPLRERVGDTTLLAEHFGEVASRRFGGPLRPLDPDSLAWFEEYSWPGNVRELENRIYRAYLESEGSMLSVPRPDGLDRPDDGMPLTYRAAKEHAIVRFERSFLTRALRRARGNVSAAARLIGTERRHLGRLLKKHGIKASSISGQPVGDPDKLGS